MKVLLLVPGIFLLFFRHVLGVFLVMALLTPLAVALSAVNLTFRASHNGIIGEELWASVAGFVCKVAKFPKRYFI